MGWPLFFRAPAPPNASDAARLLSERAARARAVAAIPIAERRVRIFNELKLSGAASPIRPRAEIAAEVRAERALRKEQRIG